MTRRKDSEATTSDEIDGDVDLRLRVVERAWLLMALERDVLAHLAERTPAAALEELAVGLERIATNGTLVSILVTDERDDRYLRHGAAPSLPKSFIDGLGLVPIAGDAGSCGTAAFRRERVIASNIATEPLWKGFQEIAGRHDLHACWSVPVIASDGALLGTFAFYYREPRVPSPEDLASMEGAARLARIVLERHRAETARARSSRRKRALFAAASVLASADDCDADGALEGLLGAVAEALGWDAGAIWSNDVDAGLMSCRASWPRESAELADFLDDTRRWRFAHGEGLPGRVALSSEPVWTTIVDEDPRFFRWRTARAANIVEGFAVPIIEDTKTTGVMELFTSRPEPADPDLLLALRTIGLQVGQFLRRARLVAELRETVRFSELFSGILAHDLRNPLNTVVMGTDILARESSSDRAARTVVRMRSAQTRMTRMVDQLLDLTRSRSGGGIAITRTPADLGELARALVSELAVAHPDRRIEVSCHGDLNGHWDHDRLAQVLSNLLGNALAHGEPSGLVAVRIDGGDPARVRIETHNLGTIPSSLLPYLFDPFRRATTTKAPSRGLGLGLYITKLLVEAHGGTVEVASDEDAGTRFVVALPRSA